MTAASGLICGCPGCPPTVVSDSVIPVPNQWQDSIQVGRMMSNCRPEEASEEAEILNQRASTVAVAGTGLGTSMEWFLTSTSGHILAKGTVVGQTNVEGGRGRPPHVGGTAETGEGARTLTTTGGDARFEWHVTPGEFSSPSSPLPAFLVFIVPFCALDNHWKSNATCGERPYSRPAVGTARGQCPYSSFSRLFRQMLYNHDRTLLLAYTSLRSSPLRHGYRVL